MFIKIYNNFFKLDLEIRSLTLIPFLYLIALCALIVSSFGLQILAFTVLAATVVSLVSIATCIYKPTSNYILNTAIITVFPHLIISIIILTSFYYHLSYILLLLLLFIPPIMALNFLVLLYIFYRIYNVTLLNNQLGL